jgi:hypothetical protein
MRTLLKIEEAAMFALALVAYNVLDLPWWWFFALLLLPDLAALGYLAGPGVGAATYNVAHHKAVAIAAYLAGVSLNLQWLIVAGIILFAHSSMDRVLGYGLKYPDSFQNTHLGQIGRARKT